MIETLGDYWETFYQKHSAVLAERYPGINSFIFFRELGDLMGLEEAVYSWSPVKLKSLAENLLKGVPFAYLLNFSEFYGRRFYVDERVLIPRPETELLVEHLMEHRRKQGRPFKNVLDVGTGSGVILLSLIRGGFAESGLGVDLSLDALSVARINARRLREAVELRQSDRLKSVYDTFDVIVSNPPYIKEKGHRQGVHQSVDSHEPHLALYLPDSSYQDWFKEFFQGVFDRLRPNGLFMMEGHEEELQEQGRLLEELGFRSVKVIKDLAGRDRFLEGVRP